jgi:hypothetical protein
MLRLRRLTLTGALALFLITGPGATPRLHAQPAPIAATNSPTPPAATTNEEGTTTVVPGQSFEGIRSIDKKTRVLYGSIAIAGLLIMVILLRVVGKKKQ